MDFYAGLKKRFGLKVSHITFPLRPDVPAGGIPLEKIFAERMIDPAKALLNLRKTAEKESLPLGDFTHTYNSRPAQELFKWAESEKKGDAFLMAAFRFFFVECKDIGDTGVLTELAAAAGLPGNEAVKVLADRLFEKEVDSDWARAREMEIQVIPTFFIGEKRLVGAQPYEAMERFVMNCL